MARKWLGFAMVLLALSLLAAFLGADLTGPTSPIGVEVELAEAVGAE